MLQYRTVEPHTLDVLKELMQIPALKDFNLVGALHFHYILVIENRLTLIFSPQLNSVMNLSLNLWKKDFLDFLTGIHIIQLGYLDLLMGSRLIL